MEQDIARGNLLRFVCLFKRHRWSEWHDGAGRKACLRCWRRVTA